MRYYITSNHDTYEYNEAYWNGELSSSNGYQTSAIITADNPKDAVILFIQSELFFNVEADDISYEDNYAFVDVLIDGQNSQANKHQIEMSKKGLCKLYIDNIIISVSKLEEVAF